jgi:hypothetical protein
MVWSQRSPEALCKRGDRRATAGPTPEGCLRLMTCVACAFQHAFGREAVPQACREFGLPAWFLATHSRDLRKLSRAAWSQGCRA